ncbi:MAG: bifunctional methylenetetrahydrofolate dehydrogenase/methenyltetrahydrofolate cyclohydrolase FolD [Acidimicrobiia bacterium]|nr:bifunctional methylenetetrahydrofolate dehydrogenase/methenyltetrahydrofolate cyclohydrolase FolD [Acidimicrobiia bacterium]
MTATILDGKLVASEVKEEVKRSVSKLDYRPGLATVLVGDDPASHSYVRGKRRDAEEVGIRSIHHELESSIAQDELEELIDSLNEDPGVDGILVQLPLPAGLDSEAIVERIDPAKDVDGLHPFNLGKLMLGRQGLRPCTPSGILRMLDRYQIDPSGARAVIVGRSFLVGRPLSMMLSEKGVDATVTVAHSRTGDLAKRTLEADILIAATGSPGLITAAQVRPGATVIDVGISRTEAGLVGDVDFDSVREVAGAITPVPGGVGPMTRAMLLTNALAAASGLRSANH